MNIHALWAHPRSVSTAFERIMRTRGDLTVLHEPFIYYYYLTRSERALPGFEPEPGHPVSYADTRAMILEKAQQGPLFFKDMAYYVLKALPEDIEFASKMSHAFIVRDPAECILSYVKRDPDFTCRELGIAAQFALFEALKAQGIEPLVFTADQLRHAPEATMARYWAHVGLDFAPHAFAWDDRVPDGWKSVQDWHASVLSKTAIEAPAPGRDVAAELAALGAPFVDYDRHHRPFYDALKDIAEKQAHQK